MTGAVTPDAGASRIVKPDEPRAESGAVNDARTCDEIVNAAAAPPNVELEPDSDTRIVLLVPSETVDVIGWPVAEIVATTLGVVERPVAIGTLTLLEPAGIVTLEGTTARAELENGLTVNPSDGAGPSSVTAAAARVPPNTDDGLIDSVLIFG